MRQAWHCPFHPWWGCCATGVPGIVLELGHSIIEHRAMRCTNLDSWLPGTLVESLPCWSSSSWIPNFKDIRSFVFCGCVHYGGNFISDSKVSSIHQLTDLLRNMVLVEMYKFQKCICEHFLMWMLQDTIAVKLAYVHIMTGYHWATGHYQNQ